MLKDGDTVVLAPLGLDLTLERRLALEQQLEEDLCLKTSKT